MFLAIVFIILGLLVLLNTMGIVVGNFWGFFWAILLLAIGIKLLVKRGRCPICMGQVWSEMMHDRMHDCDEDCDCNCDCDCDCECEHEEK